jgi:hypothetical protein
LFEFGRFSTTNRQQRKRAVRGLLRALHQPLDIPRRHSSAPGNKVMA